MKGIYIIYSEDNRYILGVSLMHGIELTQEESLFYAELSEAIENKPKSNEYDYYLTAELTWEESPKPHIEEQDIPAEEALAIILGGEV